MSKASPNPPAFPVAISEFTEEHNPGMTLRDYFAGQALVALIISYDGAAVSDDWLANAAYNLAHAMLKKREGQPA